MNDQFQWYVHKNDEQLGPMTWLQIREMAVFGKIDARHLVWRDGMEGWALASTIPGLLTTTPQLPTPPSISNKDTEVLIQPNGAGVIPPSSWRQRLLSAIALAAVVVGALFAKDLVKNYIAQSRPLDKELIGTWDCGNTVLGFASNGAGSFFGRIRGSDPMPGAHLWTMNHWSVPDANHLKLSDLVMMINDKKASDLLGGQDTLSTEMVYGVELEDGKLVLTPQGAKAFRCQKVSDDVVDGWTLQ